MMRPCSRTLDGWRDDDEKRVDGGDEQQSTRRGEVWRRSGDLSFLA